MLTSAFSFVKSNHTPLSLFFLLFLDAPYVLLKQFNMGFLFLLHTYLQCMQSKSRTCVVCSTVPLAVTSNSRHHMHAIVIASLLFGVASSCLREGNFNIQFTGNEYKLHLLSSVVFSSFAVGGNGFLYLF